MVVACTPSNFPNPVPTPVTLPVTASIPANPLRPPDASGFYYSEANIYSCVARGTTVATEVLNGARVATRVVITVVEGYHPSGTGGTVLGSWADTVDPYSSYGGFGSVTLPADTCVTVHLEFSNTSDIFSGSYTVS
jgi:hypothetical protein